MNAVVNPMILPCAPTDRQNAIFAGSRNFQFRGFCAYANQSFPPLTQATAATNISSSRNRVSYPLPIEISVSCIDFDLSTHEPFSNFSSFAPELSQL